MIDDDEVYGLKMHQIKLLADFYHMHTGRNPQEIKSLADGFSSSQSYQAINRYIELGLWAEKAGLVALRNIYGDGDDAASEIAQSALAELPK